MCMDEARLGRPKQAWWIHYKTELNLVRDSVYFGKISTLTTYIHK